MKFGLVGFSISSHLFIFSPLNVYLCMGVISGGSLLFARSHEVGSAYLCTVVDSGRLSR